MYADASNFLKMNFFEIDFGKNNQHMYAQIETYINSTIESFISQISEKYSLDKNDLKDLWSRTTSASNPASAANIEPEVEAKPKPAKSAKKTPKSDADEKSADISEATDNIDAEPKTTKKAPKSDAVEKSSSAEIEMTEKSLSKQPKTVLQDLCRKMGAKISGTKDEIVKRLLTSPQDKKEPAPAKSTKKKPSTKKSLELRKNDHGNFEHEQTGLVFDKDTKCVVGKQVPDGSVQVLTEEDIQTCKEYKFEYTMPKNLDLTEKSTEKEIEQLLEYNESDLEEEYGDDEEI